MPITIDYQNHRVACIMAGYDGGCIRICSTDNSGEHPENPTQKDNCGVVIQNGFSLIRPEIVEKSVPAVSMTGGVTPRRDWRMPTF